MKGIKKYVAAVFVLALSGVLLAGCSGQASSSAASASASASGSASASASASASSAAAQATTEELIKEIEAIPSLKSAKSATVDMKGNISIDTAAFTSGASESSSASAASAAASEATAMDIPFTMLIKADTSQDPEKLFMDIDMMGMVFEIYITGENAVVVIDGQAYGGTLQELESAGMGQYSSIEGAMSSTGANSFDKYKDAVESVAKQTTGDKTVYTVVIDSSKLVGAEAMSALSQLGMTGDASKITLTYAIGADGKLSESSMEMGGTGFSLTYDMKVYDYDKTVVPDAPEATKSLSEVMGAAGSAAAAEAAA